jgi:peptidyl-tRNA hydrolase, PTH1 family
MKKLIIGLGNPGATFRSTPHNFGFYFLDQLQKTWQLPPFQFDSSFQAQTTEGNKDNFSFLLVKPQTWMNNSGQAIRKIQEEMSFPLKDIWVIHDDLDLPWGKVKIIRNQRSAGHKGVASIIEALQSQDFYRLRLGIGPSTGKDYVLQKMNLRQRIIARKTVRQTIPQLEKELNKKEE